MMGTMYVMGGGKGGVGKSTATLAFFLTKKDGGAVKIYDGDDTNPDVARALALNDCIIDPSDLAFWTDALEATRNETVIVSLPAGGERVFLENAAAIGSAAKEDGVTVHFVSTINKSRECLLLLKAALDQLDGSGVIPSVVLNLMHGEAATFARFNSAKAIRTALAAAGGVEILLPELHYSVIDALISPGGRELEKAPTLVKNLLASWVKKLQTNITI